MYCVSIQNINLFDDFIWVPNASIIGVHYNRSDNLGCIDYERTDVVPLTPFVQTYRVWNEGLVDTDWAPGYTIQFQNRSFKTFERAVALHVSVCGMIIVYNHIGF